MWTKTEPAGAHLHTIEYVFILIVAAAAGAWIRCTQIGLQILGDDEWNAITLAACSSFSHLFTHFHVSDNCIPLTVYYKTLLHTVGLNEHGIRSLPLAAGISLLIITPNLIRQYFSRGIIALHMVLMAASPFLIFHSRWARPHGMVALLSFIAIFCFYRWIMEGRRSYALYYLVCAIVAPYFNPLACAVVLGPLLFAGVRAVCVKKNRSGSYPAGAAGLSRLIMIGLLLIAGWAAWFLPASGSIEVLSNKAGMGEGFDMQTVTGLLTTFSGFGTLPLTAGFWLFSLGGLVLLFRRNSSLAAYLLLIVVLNLMVILLLNPKGAHRHWVFARYFITSLPIILLWAAVGLNGFVGMFVALFLLNTDRFALVFKAVLAAVAIIYIIQSPLRTIYGFTNNFTNHKHYQLDYRLDVIRFLDEKPELYPRFYHQLNKEGDDAPVIEVPLPGMWYFINYHLYQRLHGRKMIIGHEGRSFLSPPRRIMHPDIDLSNMIELNQFLKLAATGARYVIVHNDLIGECRHLRKAIPDSEIFFKSMAEENHYIDATQEVPLKNLAIQLNALLRQNMPEPCYQDQWITVYRISQRECR